MRFIYLLLLCFSSVVVQAAPWIGVTERHLHQDLQVLVEWGYLDAAVTSYPVPWKGINQQLEQLSPQTMPPVVAISAMRLSHYAKLFSQHKGQRIASLYAASDNSDTTSFNGQQARSTKLSIESEHYWQRWAAKLQINHQPGGEKNLDGTYLAYQFGDWNLRLGAIDQWWGPAHTSSLIMSNNARPIPSLTFSRSQAVASDSRWLSFLGPWFFTAQMGLLEGQRHVPDTRLWSTRFNFRPFKGLELGASWVAMWGGKGQGNGLSDFIDVITFNPSCADGSETCDNALDTKAGNQLAGFDVKYSFQLFGRPISLYAQRIGEDAVDYIKITDNASLFGISSYIGNSKIYLESSDTNIACASATSTITNCYYEHDTYRSGYRRYNRAIGSTFDSDAKMLALGSQYQFEDGDILNVEALYLDLNRDGVKPSPVVNGKREKRYQLQGYYRFSYRDWLIKLGASAQRSTIDEQRNDTHLLFYSEIKYQYAD